MTETTERWREGHRLLGERLAATPDLVSETLAAPPPALAWHPGRVRRVIATGVGASAAHARLFVTLLEDAGLAARFLPPSAFATSPGAAAAADALVVFSQGLSPNARLALAHAERFAGVTIVTAVPAAAAAPDAIGHDAPPSGALHARQDVLRALTARGVGVYRVPAAEEYGTLLRVCGPQVGVAAALVLARAVVAAAGRTAAGLLAGDTVSPDDVRERLRALLRAAEHEHAALDADTLASVRGLLASGTYADLLGNVQATVQEGLLVPAPPACELLGFAHGPYQEIAARDATLLALARADAPGEDDLLARVERMLVPGRHRLVRLRATLPGALALLEHQTLVAALVLRAIARRRIDQADFPGRGRDRALYEVERPLLHAAPPLDAPPRAPVATRLAELTWPDVAALRASGCDTAILPLGSTEQHGSHLPFATDTCIADAVATRVAARLGGVLCLPALPLGCADEHLGFPGTLSLAADTLVAVVRDTGRALVRHGFVRMLVFTAHGGNYGALHAATPRLARELAPLRLEVFLDAACLTRRLEAVAAASGVSAGEAGQHAGELETSILLALAPGLVRLERATAGLLDPALPPDELFYPDLRRHAADGTVGDPRAASDARAAAYLDAWAEVLAASWSAPDAK